MAEAQRLTDALGLRSAVPVFGAILFGSVVLMLESGQKQGQAPYEGCGAAGKADLRWRGYQRMKFSMSIPFSTVQRTCSNALASCRL